VCVCHQCVCLCRWEYAWRKVKWWMSNSKNKILGLGTKIFMNSCEFSLFHFECPDRPIYSTFVRGYRYLVIVYRCAQSFPWRHFRSCCKYNPFPRRSDSKRLSEWKSESGMLAICLSAIGMWNGRSHVLFKYNLAPFCFQPWFPISITISSHVSLDPP